MKTPPTPAEAVKSVAAKPKNTPVARLRDDEVNLAPVAWGRRLARLVGSKFHVKMSLDRSKNEGVRRKTRIVIKCAKSHSAPIFVSVDMLARADEVWGVFLFVGQGAEIWKCDAHFVRRAAYINRSSQKMARAELRFKAMQRGGVLIGHLSEIEIESCRIP
jgi:hypothetical protein